MWIGDEYYYSPKMLVMISANYSLYDPDSRDFNRRRWQEAIEYKADYDRAFCALSKRRQSVIIEEDSKLERLGYYNIDYFRYASFNEMAEYLNT